jgi:hypothetical protein
MNNNVVQGIVIAVVGLVTISFAAKLAAIPFHFDRSQLGTKNWRYVVVRTFWLFCGALWILGGVFIMLDPNLAFQLHPRHMP